MVQFVNQYGLSQYEDTIKMMEDRVNQVINQQSEEIVYLIEYQNVYTAGSSSTEDELLNQGDILIIYTSRGGKFTYHGPG